MDNFITGSHSNVSHLVNHRHFQLIEWDITKYIQVEQPLAYILHFACPASPADYLKYPIQTLKAGALGTHNALGLAKSKGGRFLLASTSEVTEPVNIGNPDEISILDVAREIIALTGSAGKIVFGPMPADNPKVRQPDITLAQALLNWEPSISRKEGLRRTIGHARKHLDCLRDNVS